MKSLPIEHRIASRGGELTYHAFGQGAPLLFVGGLGANSRAFCNQVAHLSSRYRCLTWDYRGLFRDRGFGFGHVPSITDHAEDAASILASEGAERALVLGWSLGVQVALQLFASAPERVAALVLVAGGARAPWGSAPEAGPLARTFPAVLRVLDRLHGPLGSLLRAGGSSPEVFTWARRIGLVGPDTDPELFSEVVREWAQIDLDAALRTARMMMAADLSDVLYTVDVPTLVIGGDRDPFTSRAAIEHVVRGVPGAEYLMLPGASHYLLMDHAQHVNLRIDKFLAERGFSS